MGKSKDAKQSDKSFEYARKHRYDVSSSFYTKVLVYEKGANEWGERLKEDIYEWLEGNPRKKEIAL